MFEVGLLSRIRIVESALLPVTTLPFVTERLFSLSHTSFSRRVRFLNALLHIYEVFSGVSNARRLPLRHALATIDARHPVQIARCLSAHKFCGPPFAV